MQTQEKTKADLMIKAAYVLPFDAEMSVLKNAAVIVDGDSIVFVGTQVGALDAFEPLRIIDCGNAILLPGLVNTHTHAPMSYFRGLADNESLDSWLNNHIWPAERKFVNPDFVSRATELAILEMIKAGTTCFADMYFFEEVLAEAARCAGIRAVLGEAILEFPTPSAPSPQDSIKKTLDLNAEYAGEELITVSFAPHSIYTLSDAILQAVSRIARDHGLPIQIHLSETETENGNSLSKNGVSPTKHLASLGLFDGKVIAAHGVWLDEEDIAILKEKKVSLSHNPISNLKLGSGIMPLGKVIKADPDLACLGTDGAASNNTLDLWTDMRVCGLLAGFQRGQNGGVDAKQIVRMATLNGSSALELSGKTGSLKPGMRADIISVSLDKAHFLPLFDPYSHLVYCASSSDVCNVIINGRLIMKDREVLTMDQEKILYDARSFGENFS
jgi:5-methylthioadenosine/S-adenosylhomocysteine deaminase